MKRGVRRHVYRLREGKGRDICSHGLVSSGRYTCMCGVCESEVQLGYTCVHVHK